MMNMVQIQNDLKNFSDEQLISQMQNPQSQSPSFLVLGELTRRKQMRGDYQKREAEKNQSTVAQDAVNGAGVPSGGIADLAQSMAPKTNVAQNTGQAQSASNQPQPVSSSVPSQQLSSQQGYASGGPVKGAKGQPSDVENNVKEAMRNPSYLEYLKGSNPDMYSKVMSAIYRAQGQARLVDYAPIDVSARLGDTLPPAQDGMPIDVSDSSPNGMALVGPSTNNTSGIMSLDPMMGQRVHPWSDPNAIPLRKIAPFESAATLPRNMQTPPLGGLQGPMDEPYIYNPEAAGNWRHGAADPVSTAQPEQAGSSFSGMLSDVAKQQPEYDPWLAHKNFWDTLGSIGNDTTPVPEYGHQNEITQSLKKSRPHNVMPKEAPGFGVMFPDGSHKQEITYPALDPRSAGERISSIFSGARDVVGNVGDVVSEIPNAVSSMVDRGKNNSYAIGHGITGLGKAIAGDITGADKDFSKAGDYIHKDHMSAIQDPLRPDQPFVSYMNPDAKLLPVTKIPAPTVGPAASETVPADGVVAPSGMTTLPTSKPTGKGGGGTRAVGGAAGMLDAMAKQKDRDKWMALARAGFAMMSTNSEHFSDALGAGGKAGLDSLQNSNAEYEKALATMANMKARGGGGSTKDSSGLPSKSLAEKLIRNARMALDKLSVRETENMGLSKTDMAEKRRILSEIGVLNGILYSGINVSDAIQSAPKGG